MPRDGHRACAPCRGGTSSRRSSCHRAIADTLLVAVGMLRAPDALLSGFTCWDGRWYHAIALHGYVVPPHVPLTRLRGRSSRCFPRARGGGTSFGVPAPGPESRATTSRSSLRSSASIASRFGTLAARSQPRSLAHCARSALVRILDALPLRALPGGVRLGVRLGRRTTRRCGWVAAAVAALTRPNGVVLVIALLIAVGFAARRIVPTRAPGRRRAIAGWLWFNALRTGDPIRFLTAKSAWREITLIGFLNRPTT